MLNRTQGKIKLNTGQFKAKYDYLMIIAEAESNPPDECWEFCTEPDYFIQDKIRKEGKIEIEI